MIQSVSRDGIGAAATSTLLPVAGGHKGPSGSRMGAWLVVKNL